MNAQLDTYEKNRCQICGLSGRFVEASDHEAFVNWFTQSVAAGNKKFVIDFHELEYMNSSGVNQLVKVIKLLNEANASLVFTRVPERIDQLLNIIKLNALLTIHTSLEEGIQSLN